MNNKNLVSDCPGGGCTVTLSGPWTNRTHFIIEYLKGNYKCDSMMSMHRLTGLSCHG